MMPLKPSHPIHFGMLVGGSTCAHGPATTGSVAGNARTGRAAAAPSTLQVRSLTGTSAIDMYG
jgi:hypothetical protein